MRIRGGTRAAGLTGAGLAAILAAAVLGAAGCNILGPAWYFIEGPPKQPAQFTLDANRPTVVFVDDTANRLPSRALRGDIATSAEKHILAEELLLKDHLIDSRGAFQAASADRFGQQLSITEIGRSVQAEVVVYISIDEFGISPDGVTFAPVGVARVIVVDAKNDQRLWPANAGGQRIRVQLNERQGAAPTSRADSLQAQRELAIQIGRAAAELFYEHEAYQSAGKNEPG